MNRLDKPFTFRGTPLLLVVAAFHAVLLLVEKPLALEALGKSAEVLLKILPVFLIVIFCTAALNRLVKPRQITRHLGRESGVRGWFWALAAGVISHGPMYVWYPLLDDLRSHGLRNGLIGAFFASRAIKVPLLPMMIDYFGWTFTLVLSCYILIGALAQGWVLELLTRRPARTGP